MVAQVSVNLRPLVTSVTSRQSGLDTHRAHCISVIKIKQLMSIQGIFADYRTLCGQSAVFLNAETGGRTQSAVFERLS